MECDHGAINDWAYLLAILSEGPEILEAARTILDHAQAIHDQTEEALRLLRENPELAVVHAAAAREQA